MNILDIFYNYIIKEASIGKIKCGNNIYSVLFKTNINNNIDNKEMDNYLCPVLTINNSEEFNKLLIKYVNLCLDFYGTKNYNKEILNCNNYNKNRTCPEKLIMIFLWANATIDDFLNPIDYLKKRISFIENSKEIYYYSDYSDLINGNIMINIEKDNIIYETPYKMIISFINKDNDEYFFPEIKFGIYNNKVYIYAIQNFLLNGGLYSKKINRLLYKIGEGYDSEQDNYELYSDGNLKDVTSSFVVAINIAISYFHSLGYRDIEVPSILPVRYNSKSLTIERKVEQEKINEEETLQDIQENLTEKFIRTFLRLAYHYKGINITSLPFELDSNLHIKLDEDIKTDNKLLKETKELINTKNSVKNL